MIAIIHILKATVTFLISKSKSFQKEFFIIVERGKLCSMCRWREHSRSQQDHFLQWHKLQLWAIKSNNCFIPKVRKDETIFNLLDISTVVVLLRQQEGTALCVQTETALQILTRSLSLKKDQDASVDNMDWLLLLQMSKNVEAPKCLDMKIAIVLLYQQQKVALCAPTDLKCLSSFLIEKLMMHIPAATFQRSSICS